MTSVAFLACQRGHRWRWTDGERARPIVLWGMGREAALSTEWARVPPLPLIRLVPLR